MKLEENNPLYDAAARELVVRYVQRIASILHREPGVPFDVHDLAAADSDLLFDLCFFGIVQFEEQSGIEAGDTAVTPLVAFRSRSGGASPTVIIGDTSVHGLVETDTLAEGIARAQAALENGELQDERPASRTNC